MTRIKIILTHYINLFFAVTGKVLYFIKLYFNHKRINLSKLRMKSMNHESV